MVKQNLFFVTLFLLALIFLSGCTPDGESSDLVDEEIKTVLSTEDLGLPVEKVTPFIEPTGIPISDDQIYYDIYAILDRETMLIRVDQKIEFTNGKPQVTKDVLFAVLPNTYVNGFKINSILVDGEPGEFVLTGQELKITNLNIAHAAKVEILISFELTLPKAVQGNPEIIRPQIYGYTDQQINLVDWYPMIVPRKDDGVWILHHPGYYGEHLVYPLSSGIVSLELQNFLENPIVAASSEGSRNGKTLKYEFSDFRDFVISIGVNPGVLEGESSGILIRSLYLPGYEIAGQAVLDTTIQAVTLYQEIFGDLDNLIITAVQGDFDDGMEFEGLYYLSHSFYNLYDGNPDQYLVMVAAHETCHQWFFGSVANDQAFEPWLDESLATYCERLYYEKYYPELLDWWWAARIDFYQPEGKIDGNIYDYQGFTPYTNAVYRRGAIYYEDLRKLIGDEAFFSFLKDYYLTSKDQIVSAESYFSILRRHTSIDLTPLLGEYFGSEN